MRLDDSRPIWAQLALEFRRRIASGEWAAGAKVPPVRELALELGVNPNTVQKSLAEVDRLGLTTTERTAGRFVTRDAAAVAATRAALAAATADGFATAASGLGMSLDEARSLLTERWPAAATSGTAPSGAADSTTSGPDRTPASAGTDDTADDGRKDD